MQITPEMKYTTDHREQLRNYILVAVRGIGKQKISIKDVRSQGRGVVQREHFSDKGGFFKCGYPHFLVQKLRIFRNLWCVRTDRRRIELVRIFCGQGRRVNFLRFVRTSFMNGS